MEVNGYNQLSGYHSLKYMILCSIEERNSNRFWTTRENDDRNVHFWVNYSFKSRPRPKCMFKPI